MELDRAAVVVTFVNIVEKAVVGASSLRDGGWLSC